MREVELSSAIGLSLSEEPLNTLKDKLGLSNTILAIDMMLQ
jgi:hypothetical protein